MQTQDKYEKCVVIKQRSNQQIIAKVYYKHNGEHTMDPGPGFADFAGSGTLSIGSTTVAGSNEISIGNKLVSVSSNLYTENITDPNAIQQSLMGDSSHHD